AEAMGIPYIHAAYCPATLPSPDHPPPLLRTASLPRPVNRLLWRAYEWTWNSLFKNHLNEHRATLGLAPVKGMVHYVTTDHPWLAADVALAPASPPGPASVHQCGAWLLDDPTPLPDPLGQFLAAGEPPVYFGFGSMDTAPA